MSTLRSQQLHIEQWQENDKRIFGLVTGTEDRSFFELNCLLCIESFDNIIDFIIHIKSKHTIVEEFKEDVEQDEMEGDFIITEEKEEMDNDDNVLDEFIVFKDDEMNTNTSEEEERTDDSSSWSQSQFKANKKNCWTQTKVKQTNGRRSTNHEEESELPAFELVKVSSDYNESSDLTTDEVKENQSFGENYPFVETLLIGNNLTHDQLECMIDGYKEHPLLWDSQIPGHTSVFSRGNAYYLIVEYMKEKFNVDLTVKCVKRLLYRLTVRYKNIARRKDKTKTINSEDAWIMDKLSFLKTDKEENRAETEYLIECYKQHPGLWNPQEKEKKDRNFRVRAFLSIAEAMNEKFDQQLTWKCAKKRVCVLLCRHKAEMRRKAEDQAPTSDAWLLKKLSFIQVKKNVRRKNENPLSNEQIEYMITIYQQYPVLWNPRVPEYTNSFARNEVYAEIAQIMNDAFNIEQTGRTIRAIFNNLYKRIKMAKFYGKASEPWFYDRMSFITELGNDESLKPKKVDHDSVQQFKEDEDFNSNFIDFYERVPCLWYKRNPDYTNPEKRKEAENFLIQSMKDKYNIDFDEKQLQEKIAIILYLYAEMKLKIKSKEIDQDDEANANGSASADEPWYCKKLSFLQQKSVKKILTTDSKPLAQFQCEICKTKFHQENKLKVHLYSEHRIKAFVCEICKKVFRNAHFLREHSNTHLSFEDRPFACKLCGSRFANRINCIIHERRHTKSFSHSCNLCDKKFFTTVELRTHIRRHTGEKPFICDECGMKFYTSGALSTHRQKHNKERIFKCQICPMAFYSNETLRSHIKSHSSVRDFVCDICGKGFKLKTTLRQHKLLHSDSKKYVCRICGQSFSQNAGLHSHMKSH